MSIADLLEMEKEVIRKEYELKIQELEQQMEDGSIGGIDWLKERLNIKTLETLKNKLLYPFRDELEPNIIYYPSQKRVPWRVNKTKFNKWLTDNFGRIDWGK